MSFQRQRIIDRSFRFFIKNSYANTSVNKIIESLDIAKGTFYHYFESKEVLLDAVVDQQIKESLDAINKIIEDTSLNALQKINHFFASFRLYNSENMMLFKPLLKVIYSDANLLFRHKLHNNRLEHLTPLLESIILQGVDEDRFNITHSRDTAEMLLMLDHAFIEVTMKFLFSGQDHQKEFFYSKKKHYEDMISKCLDTRRGSVHLIPDKLLDLFET